jgi:hypothetical protein
VKEAAVVVVARRPVFQRLLAALRADLVDLVPVAQAVFPVPAGHQAELAVAVRAAEPTGLFQLLPAKSVIASLNVSAGESPMKAFLVKR